MQHTTTTTAAKSSKRAPVKALNLDAAAVKAASKAERERKAASKAALKAQNAAPVAPVAPPAEKEAAKRAIEAVACLAALTVDAAAYGVTVTDAWLAEQGVSPDGTPLPEAKQRYNGPMLALAAARLTYVQAPNGMPCCGDVVATLCGQYTREQIVAGLILALGLGYNPYLHLNAGQQSMNLRNKARYQVLTGLLSLATIHAALELQVPTIAA